MKRSFVLSGLFLTQLALAQPLVIDAPVKHLYVPDGFDSNDSVEVVVTGNFPNPCYSRNDVSVAVVGDQINVTVTALYPGDQKLLCPQMLIPYREIVSVGNLQGGEYMINVNNTLQDKLVVAEASSSAVDEHLYAAIDDIEKKAGPGNTYILHGWRYSPCVELDRVEVRSNRKDTLSVLPIMKQVSDFCPMKMTPVQYEVNLDFRDIKIREALIHVRTMDGKSYNDIIKLGERR